MIQQTRGKSSKWFWTFKQSSVLVFVQMVYTYIWNWIKTQYRLFLSLKKSNFLKHTQYLNVYIYLNIYTHTHIYSLQRTTSLFSTLFSCECPGTSHYACFKSTGSGKSWCPARQTRRASGSQLPPGAHTGPVSLDGAQHPPKLHTAPAHEKAGVGEML